MNNKWSKEYISYLRVILWQFYKSHILFAMLICILFGLLIAFINTYFYPSYYWYNFSYDKSIEFLFCEYTDMNRFVRQPVNTFTNIFYVAITYFFVNKGRQDAIDYRPYNLVTANPLYSYIMAFILFYTFICSTFFHSSLIHFASKLDYSAVYSVSLFPIMYFSHRFMLVLRNKKITLKHPKETRLLAIIFTSIYLVLTFLLPDYLVHPIVLILIIGLIVLGVLFEVKQVNYTNKLYLLLTSLFISVAIFFFKIDFTKIACNPNSIFQPHSFWHLLNALAIFYFYLYIRSENYSPKHDIKLEKYKSKFFK